MVRRELPRACALEHELPMEIYETRSGGSLGVLTQVCPTCRAVAFLSQVDERAASEIARQFKTADLPPQTSRQPR